MALPVDVRDIYKFGKEITADRDEPVAVAVLVEVDAPEGLFESVREVMRPRTSQAFVDVKVIEDGMDVPVGADAVVILVGSATAAATDVVGEMRSRVVPTVALALRPDRGSLDYDLGLPVDDVLVGEDVDVLVGEDFAGWLADRLGAKRLSVGMNFDFTRRAVAMEIVKSTALQNTLIGVVTILPGTDMPIMTANQAKMLLQLATVFGQRIGADRLGELAAVVGGGFALRAVARQALTSVPGFGWAVKGGIAYAGTMAMGRTAVAWFEEGADLTQVASQLKGLGRRGQEPGLEVTGTTAALEAPAASESRDEGDDRAAGPVQQTLEIGPARDGG